jgi:glycosyltransferase involved in cell wall biosynthesis
MRQAIKTPVGDKPAGVQGLIAPQRTARLALHESEGSVGVMRFDSPNGPAGQERGAEPRAAAELQLSVVVPVYGCGACVEHLYERLTATLANMGVSYELVLVDDRAGDGSWPLIEALAQRDGAVKGILLSRNFGQHAAITAGLRHARGAWVAVMDCDLQDPPEDLPRLYAKALEGHDIVFGRRVSKPTGLVRRQLGKLYFAGIRVFAGSQIDGQYGTFSVISRKVVEAFLQFRDQDRHYMMILTWLRFDTVAVDYEPARRYRGRSSYSLSKLLEHAFDGVFFQTTVLLRWIVYAGFCLAGVGTLLACFLIYVRVVGTVYPGWTSIVAGGLFLGGFIITTIGITGLYVGKVFDQVRERPVYVVDRVVGAQEVAPAKDIQPEIDSAPALGAARASASHTPLPAPHERVAKRVEAV